MKIKISKKELKFLIVYTLIALIALNFKIMCVSGESMMPTIKDKSFHLGVNKYIGKTLLKHGSIVAFKPDNSSAVDGKTLIKRVIGLPNDHVQIKNGIIYLNDEKLDEPYVESFSSENIDVYIPDGKMFCVGDNRNNSYDSRFAEIGFVDINRDLKAYYLF